MYADELTDSMDRAITETNRRRAIQMQYNQDHGIVPQTIKKSVRDTIRASIVAEASEKYDIDVFVMGDDWTGKFDFLKDYCEVVYLPRTENISTTMIKEKLNKKIQQDFFLLSRLLIHKTTYTTIYIKQNFKKVIVSVTIKDTIVRGDILAKPGRKKKTVENENVVQDIIETTEIVEKQIKEINSVYDDVNIFPYVIMPNHIHFIIEIDGSSGTPTPTNARIPSIISTFKRMTNKKVGFKLWQRGYNDHIIRNDEDYLRIAEYIMNNPYGKIW